MERAAHQLLLDGPEHAAVPRVAVRRLSPPVESAWPPSYLCANLLALIPARSLVALTCILAYPLRRGHVPPGSPPVQQLSTFHKQKIISQ